MFDQFKLVDLTHALDENAPTWTGGCGFSYEIKRDYDSGVRVQKYTMHAGVGTHIDAPSHFIRGGKNVGDIPLETLMVPVCVIDVKARIAPNLFVTPKDVKEYEREHGKIKKGALVIARTGWERYWNTPEKYRNPVGDKVAFPGLTGEAAEMLVDLGVCGIGIDTLSPDGSNCEAFPVHHAVLGSGGYILENLTNLDRLPPKGAYVIALPPKIAEGAEATLRVVGLCPIEK